jgi:tetratricopeptide (TPR) repeat protein
MPLREAALEKALELDNTLAEAHAALAGYRCWGEWDWKGAETAFRRAIELSPNYPDARAFYSHFLNMMRRPEEAMAQIERALELDPLSALFQAFYGVDLMIVRRYDDAIAQFQKVLRTVPNHGVALNMIWIAFHNNGMYEEALAGAKAWYAVFYRYREVEEALARGYAEGGYRRAMSCAAEALEARSGTTYVSPWEIAELYVLAGKNDRALEWIERSVEARDPNIVYIGVFPEFDSLQDDPRFKDLLRKMNLPELQ